MSKSKTIWSLRKVVDFILIIINAAAPLVGVVWLGWDITEVIFLYSVEAGCATVYHAVVYLQTYRRIADARLKEGYLGTALLRLLFEATLTLGALTILLDAVTGHRTTVFDDPDIVLHYLWITLIPTGSITVHYLNKIIEQWRQRSSQPLVQVSSVWFWTLTLPLPAFIYSYVLSISSWYWFVGLLVLIVVIKLLTELVQFFGRDQRPFPEQPNALILRSSPYSGQAIVNLLWSYTIIGVGYMAVNPFTHDSSYTLVENLLIYLGFSLVVSPFLIPRRATLTLNTAAKQIEIDQRWFTHSQRIIPLTDIVKVTTKHNARKIVYMYRFKLRDGSVWKCTNSAFNPVEWQAWMKQLSIPLS